MDRRLKRDVEGNREAVDEGKHHDGQVPSYLALVVVMEHKLGQLRSRLQELVSYHWNVVGALFSQLRGDFLLNRPLSNVGQLDGDFRLTWSHSMDRLFYAVLYHMFY